MESVSAMGPAGTDEGERVIPTRGDEVEQWLERRLGDMVPAGERFAAVSGLLIEYRYRAYRGIPLSDPDPWKV
ncbi:hypothetical protein GCM10010466_29600 [Planomonospora alba]|uniref:Uncharacterized protein n=1 Tax=Planomonospora alba TaxID=161354 RepID=A0ABP6N562_9ACTN